jgi:GT2 family glycosyltransferase
MPSVLHRKPGNPYYIHAPDYRETSSGVCVLHYLCHALNLSGREAYISWGRLLNPELKTPVLTQEIADLHIKQGRQPITVYPEVVPHNPLAAGVVVRYILNREGALTGKGINAGKDDIFFYYVEDFVGERGGGNVLTIPVIDSELFSPPSVEGVRRKYYLYLNRFPLAKVDFSQLPADIEILSLEDPKTLVQLAEIFKGAAALYSYEMSATCTEAMLCGCPVIYLKEGGITALPFPQYFGDSGAALIDEEGGLERARATTLQARQGWLDIEARFWGQLEYFIEVTQRVADDYKANPKNSLLARWVEARVPTAVQARIIKDYLADAQGGPVIALFILDWSGQLEKVKATLASLTPEHCVYASTRIFVISPLSAPKTSADDKLRFFSATRESAVGTINSLIESMDFDWCMVAEAGVEFTSSGLMMAALELLNAPGCIAVYGDELQVMSDGQMGGAFRPGFNLDMLLSFPVVMARHWLFRRDVLMAMGGFNPDYAEALTLELILRLVEQEGMAGVGHIDEPLLIAAAPALLDNTTEQRAILEHLRRRGYMKAELVANQPGRYRVRYGHERRPLVSIIIPTKDQLPILQRCVESLLEKTVYDNYEVLIVDNASQTPDAINWLGAVEAMGEAKVRVLRYPHPFNYSAINNAAAAEARGDYLVLLNNDTAIISPSWLDELLNHALRPEVGVVGAKLLYPDGTIQHAGVVLGLRGPADHPFIGEPMDAAGYMHRLQVDQNYSAVTAACLMVRKSVYEQVGGLDESFKVSYNDVDFCLKVREAGYLLVWTPHAVVMHEGSVSQARVDPQAVEVKRRRFVAEQDALYSRWLPLLARDPAYNRNLSLNGVGFELEKDVPFTWRPLVWRPQPIVLAHPADAWGCGNYRVTKPFLAMAEKGLIDGMIATGLLHVVDLERYDPDVIILQRQTADDQLEAIRRMHAFSRAFKVYELDDYLPNLPIKSIHRKDMPKDVMRSLRRGLGYVDRFVVSTEALADAFAGLHSDIRVVENRLPVDWWKGLSSRRRRGKKPRVGWAGGVGHSGDLELITDVVKELVKEVEWVFFGMCPDKLRGYVHEVHAGIDIERYPAALAALDLDLALAPLEQNLFNECKSNLRLLEYGACGFPVVCTDIRCYQGDLPVTRVKNRFRDWVEAIRMHIHDLDATAKQGDALKAAVLNNWMLEGGNLELWRKAWLPQ